MSATNEVVKHIHLKDIHPFPDHPFEVSDDDEWKIPFRVQKIMELLRI